MMTNRERLTELRYQMEKNSFILSIFEARIAVVLHAEEMGYPDTETAQILKISPQYVSMIRALKDKYSKEMAPNGFKASSIEDLAQIIYDRVYISDWKRGAEYSRFDTALLDSWFELKQRQEALFDSIIDKQQAQAVFKDSYFQKFGKKLSIREIEQKPEHKKQKEKPESEPEETDENLFDFCEYHRKETEAKLLCKMYREGIIDEKTVLEYLDEPNWDHDTFVRVVDMFEEKEEAE